MSGSCAARSADALFTWLVVRRCHIWRKTWIGAMLQRHSHLFATCPFSLGLNGDDKCFSADDMARVIEPFIRTQTVWSRRSIYAQFLTLIASLFRSPAPQFWTKHCSAILYSMVKMPQHTSIMIASLRRNTIDVRVSNLSWCSNRSSSC